MTPAPRPAFGIRIPCRCGQCRKCRQNAAKRGHYQRNRDRLKQYAREHRMSREVAVGRSDAELDAMALRWVEAMDLKGRQW